MLLKIDQLQAMIKRMDAFQGRSGADGDNLKQILVECQQYEDTTVEQLNQLVLEKTDLETKVQILTQKDQDYKYQVDDLQKRLDEDSRSLREHNEKLEEQLEQRQKESNDILNERAGLRDSIAKLEDAKTEADQKMDKIISDRDNFEQEARALAEERERLETEMKSMINDLRKNQEALKAEEKREKSWLNERKTLEARFKEMVDDRELEREELHRLRQQTKENQHIMDHMRVSETPAPGEISDRGEEAALVPEGSSKIERDLTSDDEREPESDLINGHQSGVMPSASSDNEDDYISNGSHEVPQRESVGVGPGYYSSDGVDLSSDSEYDRLSSEPRIVEESKPAAEPESSDRSQSPGSSVAATPMAKWALYVCQKIVETFTENSITFNPEELAAYMTPGSTNAMEIVDRVMPALKQKVDAATALKSPPSPVPEESSSDSRPPSPVHIPVETTEICIQCDIEKSSLQRVAQLTSEKDKLAGKLENLQKENEAIGRKLDQSKKASEQEQVQASKQRKSLQENVKRLEEQVQTVSQGRLEFESKLDDRQKVNERLEDTIKSKDERIKKLVKDAARLESTNEQNTSKYRKEAITKQQELDTIQGHSRRQRLIIQIVLVVLFVLLLPFLDMVICCDHSNNGSISYARQMLSWMEFTRFERLMSGQC